MLARDFMNTSVFTVKPETGILDVENAFLEYGISMIPVINDDNVVQGLITEQDLFSSYHRLHLPTYIKLLKETDFISRDKKSLPYVTDKIIRTKAMDVMNRNVFFAGPDLEMEKLAEILAVKGTVGVAVVDHANHLLGIISRSDFIKKVVNLNAEKIPQPKTKQRFIDEETRYTYSDFRSRFAFVAKARANIWLTTAIVLFIVGFVAGIIYIANPGL